jgi:prepilin-type N-terminal cleavage/methylation domain-containing protein
MGARAGRSRGAARGGFTLVESVATIIVLSVLGSAASFLIVNTAEQFTEAADTAQLHAEASAAMERITGELRNIDYDDSATGDAPDISAVTATSIAWNDDWSLALSGDQVLLTEDGGAAAALLDDVSAFTVQTYDESNAALGASLTGDACDPIRRIAITLTVTRNGQSATLRSRVFIRSLMSGAGDG